MPYYIFAFLAAIFFGLATIFGKLTGKYGIKNIYLFNFLWGFFDAVVLLPVLALTDVKWPREYFNLLFASFIWAYGGLLWIYCLSKIDVSIVTSLGNLRTGFTVLLGVLFFKEVLQFDQYLYIILIFICGFLATYDGKIHKVKFFEKNIWLLILSTLFFSGQGFFIGRSVMVNGLWTTSIGVIYLGTLMLLPTYFLFKKDLLNLNRKGLLGTFITAIIATIGTVSSNKAMSGNVSIASTIISIPVALILAPLFSLLFPSLLEKNSLKVYLVRFSATGLMIFCAWKLTF